MGSVNIDKTIGINFKDGKYQGYSGKLTNEELLILIQGLIDHGNADHSFPGFQDETIRDEYHTFKSLYDIRLAYNVALFNLMYINDESVDYLPHKSWKHHDGKYCFGKEKEWFIVSIKLPTGLISNHYKKEHWDLFKIPEVEKALFEFDGHTTEDVITRLKSL